MRRFATPYDRLELVSIKDRMSADTVRHFVYDMDASAIGNRQGGNFPTDIELIMREFSRSPHFCRKSEFTFFLRKHNLIVFTIYALREKDSICGQLAELIREPTNTSLPEQHCELTFPYILDYQC